MIELYAVLMSLKTESIWDQGLFDTSDVTWEVINSKRRDECTIKFKTDGSFNVVKLYLAIAMLKEKMESELNILEAAEGEH